MYDVTIIGAGVVGSLIARELSKYSLKICLLEKDSDIASGTSKANSSIVHAGYDSVPGTLKAKLNVSGNSLMENLCAELDVPFKRIGSLVLAFTDDDLSTIQHLYEQGLESGVPNLTILSPEEVLKDEPNLSHEIKGALAAPSAAVICPYELTIAGVENAISNGAQLFNNFEVTAVETCQDTDTFYIITSKSGKTIHSRYVINAAGLFSDKISNLFGDFSFTIHPRKGEYILFDRKDKQPVGKIIFQTPTKMGKGILVTPTVDGNLLLGPTATEIDERDDLSTTPSNLQNVIAGSLKSIPSLNFRNIITSFTGIRAAGSTGDFIITHSKFSKNLINVAGIESPGLTAAPSIALHVKQILFDIGLNAESKANFISKRSSIKRFRDMDNACRQEMIRANPLYGNIICRCELVTEAEIVQSINRPAGATSLDGIKRRTRAGMGRCQGGFCSPRIVSIIARELNIPLEDVVKSDAGSNIIFSMLKTLNIDT